jgi:putative colanic acid biosynthesis UDP-glucose lipid carrier transferase
MAGGKLLETAVDAEPVHARERPQLALSDSPLVFVVKCLLFPIVPVMTLLTWLEIGKVPLQGAYFVIAVLTFLGASEFLGIARIGAAKPRIRLRVMFVDVTARWLVLVTFIGVVVYLCGFARSVNYPVLLAWVATTPITLCAAQLGVSRWLARHPRRESAMRRAVIVGLTEMGARLESALESDELLGTAVAGYFEDRRPERIAAKGEAPVLDRTSGLAEYVARNNIEQVYITLPMTRSTRIVSLLDQLHDSTASIYFVPDLFAFDLIQARFDVLHGIPIVAIRETPFHGAAWVAKRASDVVISSAALVFLMPVLAVVALCIRMDSAGPILFKQKRYGLDGHEILVYKFRSMRVTEDGKEKFRAASRGDSRITRVGAFIRKTSLDELPQLLNVLEGSMSIVGPRPHPVAMNEHYRRAIPGYMVRHKVKPGITGWAQVNGYRGGDDLESMRKRIEFDLAYLRNWSLGLDCRILLKTLAVVWRDRHAY